MRGGLEGIKDRTKNEIYRNPHEKEYGLLEASVKEYFLDHDTASGRWGDPGRLPLENQGTRLPTLKMP